MREQLIQYIDLLFAGAPQAEDIKQEILHNTLDRYDDLIAQGKTPEAAYSLSISGIGDINEILGNAAQQTQQTTQPSQPQAAPEGKDAEKEKRLTKAAAIAFFILCPVPLLILENVIGLCLLLAMVAAGVALLVLYGKDVPTEAEDKNPRSPLHKTLIGIVWGIGVCVYFLLSFETGAWYITWLLFPITGCICGLITACFDLTKVFLSAVIRIVIFGILIVVMIAALLGTYFGISVLSYASDAVINDGTLASSGSVSADQIRDIEIQWVSGSITIEKGDTENIQFSETSGLDEDQKLVWKQSGDRLIIQFSKPTSFSIISFGSFSDFSKDLVVTVPNDWVCDELDIDSVSARIDVTAIQANEIDLVNVSGSCSFESCVARQFISETVSGSVYYEGQLDELDFNTVSADCTAALSNSPSEIELEGVSGDLTLVLPADCGFTVSLDSVSGDFSSDYATTSSNSRHIYGDGSCKISADSVSGDIRIKAPK